jgi:hypothetical protein
VRAIYQFAHNNYLTTTCHNHKLLTVSQKISKNHERKFRIITPEQDGQALKQESFSCRRRAGFAVALWMQHREQTTVGKISSFTAKDVAFRMQQ